MKNFMLNALDTIQQVVIYASLAVISFATGLGIVWYYCAINGGDMFRTLGF